MFTNISSKTRIKKAGNLIYCPECRKYERIHSLQWKEKTCDGCQSTFAKKDWLEHIWVKDTTPQIEECYAKGCFIEKPDEEVMQDYAFDAFGVEVTEEFRRTELNAVERLNKLLIRLRDRRLLFNYRRPTFRGNCHDVLINDVRLEGRFIADLLHPAVIYEQYLYNQGDLSSLATSETSHDGQSIVDSLLSRLLKLE